MTLIQGDCVEAMREMPEDSVDAVVTDPPYGIRFMGKAWDAPGISQGAKTMQEHEVAHITVDGKTRTATAYGLAVHAGTYDRSTSANRQYQQWCIEWARECLRVLKPGGYLLASGSTRTYHRLACAIEDAGFEIRDSITWIYGSGFPKSKNLGNGFGTALKPAHEPIVLARKPLSEKSVARNVLEHGTGALNIDASRVSTIEDLNGGRYRGNHKGKDGSAYMEGVNKPSAGQYVQPSGRWPSNIILSHSPECQRVGVKRVRGHKGGDTVAPYASPITWNVSNTSGGPRTGHTDPDGFEEVEAWECVDGCPVRELDLQSGTGKGNGHFPKRRGGEGPQIYGNGKGLPKEEQDERHLKDQGGASRFFKTFEGEQYDVDMHTDRPSMEDATIGANTDTNMQEVSQTGDFVPLDNEPGFLYCAKSSRRERNAGLEGMQEKPTAAMQGNLVSGQRLAGNGTPIKTPVRANTHPTVKPLALMRYLVKLVTPPGGVVLDPFAGSGSTLVAAIQEGFEAVGIEQDASYIEIAERRIAHTRAEIESQPLALEV